MTHEDDQVAIIEAGQVKLIPQPIADLMELAGTEFIYLEQTADGHIHATPSTEPPMENATTPTIDLDDVLSKALDGAIDDAIAQAGGFDRRDPRDKMVNVRFTQAELDLLDALAADKGTTRIEIIRRLMARGLGQDHALNRLTTAIQSIIYNARKFTIIRRLGADNVRLAEEAMEDLKR